ncbi:hypothetical protein AB0F17_43290 [Nonomuraea sp. NPDC026600]|uniref:hypothetical protein n=1 Tax=Nonomuraea sp. NPDC026600 TaxID=3155363 RepID=UPI0033EEAE7E
MGMTTPYEGFLAPQLAHLGFPEGVIEQGDQDTGHWYLRTYRHQQAEVIVNEQTGDVTVNRLADDADDTNGWPIAFTSGTFKGADISAVSIAAWVVLTQHHHVDRPFGDVMSRVSPALDSLAAAFPMAA